jgi:hypothetical protein
MSVTPLDYATAPRRSAMRAVLVALATAVVVGLVIATFVQVRKPTAQLSDFGAYYRAGQAVAAGRSPYTLDAKYGELGAYMYCPAFAHVVCRPLAGLTYVWAMRAFLAINWLATAAVVALSLRLVRTEPGCVGPRRAQPASDVAQPVDPFWVGVIACCSAGTYLWADLQTGLVATLLLLACLGWLSLTLAGRPVLGGLSLSLAVGLKIYPLLLAPYLLLRRQWWPGLIGLAAGLLLQFATPAMFVGSRGLLPLHREWLRFCLDTQLPAQTIRTGNQSLLGVLARTQPISDGVHVFSPAHLQALERAYPAVVVLVTIALYVGHWVRRNRHALAEVSVLLIWMTVASPRAWTFNFAAELPAAAVLAGVALRRDRRWPLAVVALASAVWAVTFNTNRLGTPAGWSLGVQLLYDKHFIAAVAIAGAVALTVKTDGDERRERSPGCTFGAPG